MIGTGDKQGKIELSLKQLRANRTTLGVFHGDHFR